MIVYLRLSTWVKFVPFLEYDVKTRHVIYTTNAVESSNTRYRQAVRARGHSLSKAATIKHLYLVTLSLDPTDGKGARWVMKQKPTLNAFATTLAAQFEKITHEQKPLDPTCRLPDRPTDELQGDLDTLITHLNILTDREHRTSGRALAERDGWQGLRVEALRRSRICYSGEH